jgi:hypothetical protein
MTSVYSSRERTLPQIGYPLGVRVTSGLSISCLGCLFEVVSAALVDGTSINLLYHVQDALTASEADVGGREAAWPTGATRLGRISRRCARSTNLNEGMPAT